MPSKKDFAQFCSQIQLAQKLRKIDVVVYFSKFHLIIAQTLLRAGLISSIIEKKNKKNHKLILKLKYFNSGEPVIKKINFLLRKKKSIFISLEKLRLYESQKPLILSTNKGIMTNNEAVLTFNGGKVLFQVVT